MYPYLLLLALKLCEIQGELQDSTLDEDVSSSTAASLLPPVV
jgi:hypothetical protein